MTAWNAKFLPYPAISTFGVVNQDLDLDALIRVCIEFKELFKKDRYMEAEYLLLSRIVYRMKQKFRTSKDFKYLERIYKCLKVYFNINFSQYIGRFLELVPRRYKTDTRLPSRNLLDYILIRIQGVTKLLEKMVHFCIETADLLLVRIKTGHFWKIALIVYGVVSRIFTLAKFTVNQLCEFYNKLFVFSKMLLGSKKWLPEGYALPNDLKEWLNISWLDDDIQIIEPSIPTSDIMKFFDLVEDSDIEFCDEYILVQEENDSKELELTTSITTVKVEDGDVKKEEEDPGEVIEISDTNFPINRKYIKEEDIGEVIEIIDTKFPIKRENKRKMENSQQGSKKKLSRAKKRRYFNRKIVG